MIKNERQYRITKAQAEKFERALEETRHHPIDSSEIDPVIQDAITAGMQSQLDDLNAQLDEYEALQSGRYKVLELSTFEDLPCALIRARIASGLTQKELAARLGMREQQVQRYEATDYAGASIERIKEIVHALGIRVREDVFLAGTDVSMRHLLRRLADLGLDRDFVMRRLLPYAEDGDPAVSRNEDAVLALQAASRMNRIFGTTPAAIFQDSPLNVSYPAAAAARFKVSSRASQLRLSAYTAYAHYMALLVLDATSAAHTAALPRNASDVRAAIVCKYGLITFKSVLDYVWSLGIPVLPLADPGAFHGACWRVEGRNILVLKQQARYPARWLYDLLHEYYHAASEPGCADFELVELEETSTERRESPEEQAATQFAADVVLDSRADELAQTCARTAKGMIPRLKAVVPQVAARSGVPVDSLAYYIAYRLSQERQDWWGGATNLQVTDVDPWLIARDTLLSRLDLSRLNPIDGELLLQAVSDRPG